MPRENVAAMLDRSMLRYYAIAALIVAVIGALVFARRLVTRDFTLHSETPLPPRAVDPESARPRPQSTFADDAPWALAALPGCFDQLASTDGPAADVAPPATALRVAPGTFVAAGACRIVVGAHDLWVERGADRLRVPPEAALYREPDGTLVTTYLRHGRREVRHYRLVR